MQTSNFTSIYKLQFPATKNLREVHKRDSIMLGYSASDLNCIDPSPVCWKLMLSGKSGLDYLFNMLARNWITRNDRLFYPATAANILLVTWIGKIQARCVES